MKMTLARSFLTTGLFILLLLTALMTSRTAMSTESDPVADAIEEYLAFTTYSSSLLWPEQIPKQEWQNILVIDARDATQYAQDHIPGAVNIEWREIVARRAELPADRTVLIYCNSGSLSAQSVFALRLLGMENVKVLQDGFEGWKAKGGFDAHQQATEAAGH
ncbi:rhodanese-like domain-containing protein [Thiohalophilus sp.]|uniref:rhodanese-like domain-containing protein n=1 Tax=Thiohalophilus sp. TaxID=3028392 RepID=UPI002ACEC563|nr:rhodanese-like domain-containing protein [Thiohalophilus sp.]MDZ7662962.1 rhodanese-like domain-containing protein [Thiohalophilus sp.]